MARFLRRLLLLALLAASVAAALRALRGRRALGTAPDAGPSWPPINPAGAPGAAERAPAGQPLDATAAPLPSPDLPAPAWVAPVDGACPVGYPIKANRSGIYHVPGGQFYDRTVPERCYPDQPTAEADGYRAARR